MSKRARVFRQQSFAFGGAFAVLSATLFLVLSVPAPASAGVANADAILSSYYGLSASGQVEWEYTSFECLVARLYVNGILKEESWETCGSSGTDSLWVSGAGEAGQWRIQLWSTSFSTERWSKTWQLPGLALTTAVTPTSGEIGMSFVASSTLRLDSSGPDVYQGIGVYTIASGTTSVQNSVALLLVSEHYFTFYGESPQASLQESKMAATLSFSQAGSYTITASYQDALGSVSGASSTVTVTNQFSDLQTQLDDLQNQIDDLIAENERLQQNQTASQADVGNLQAELSSARALNSILAVLGIVLAVVAIALGLRGRRSRRVSVVGQPPPPSAP